MGFCYTPLITGVPLASSALISACMGVFVLSRFSRVQLFATPWTAARQAPLSMRFSRQEEWSGLPFPSLEDIPDPGIKPESPVLGGGFFFTTEPLGTPGTRNFYGFREPQKVTFWELEDNPVCASSLPPFSPLHLVSWKTAVASWIRS